MSDDADLLTQEEIQNAMGDDQSRDYSDAAAEARVQEKRRQAQEEPDYKTQAAYLRGRLEAQQEGGGQQQRQQDPIAEVEAKIREAEANLPEFNRERPESFFERQAAEAEVQRLREKRMELKIEQQQNQVLETQAYTAVQNYKSQWRSDPVFQQVEQDFDAAVEQLDPAVRRNPAMLDMLRKNFMFDAINNQGSGRKMPPPPPGQAGRTQMEQQQKRRQESQTQWKNELDQRLGQFYGRSPEEFYNEPAMEANGNGLQIYSIPSRKRGRKA